MQICPKSSEEVLFIKVRQMYLLRITKFRFLDLFFYAYPGYVFRFSFLTTLDIYKDYFKGHHVVVTLVVACIL